jgi:phage gp46-like protein
MLSLKYDATLGEYDLDLAADGTLAQTDSIAPAVIVSLLTHATAPRGSKPATRRRGYWADAYSSAGSLGSLVWLSLTDGKIDTTTARDIEQAATAALTWLTREGVAERVVVSAQRSQKDRLDLTIEITLADGTTELVDLAGAES